jgi:WD40 repeat protein
MSADGRLVVFASHAANSWDTAVVWWDLDSGTIGGRITTPPYVTDVWFGPDDNTILGYGLSPGPNAHLLAIDRRTGAVRTLADGLDSLRGVAISADGRYAATCSRTELNASFQRDAVYTSMRTSDGVQQERHTVKVSDCYPLAIDTTGNYLVYDNPQAAILVDLRQGKELSSVERPSRILRGGPARIVTSDSKLLLIRGGDRAIFCAELTKPLLYASRSALTPDGQSVIVVARGGAHIEVWPVLGTERIAQAPRAEPHWDGKHNFRIALNRQGSLLADREGVNKVVMREVPSLRPVAVITTAMPPESNGESELSLFFNAEGNLITAAGATIQLWDGTTGRLIHDYDVSNLVEAGNSYTITAYPAPDHVSIAELRTSTIHIINLRDGIQTQQLEIGYPILAAQFDPSGRYFAILRTGRTIELWRRDPLVKELGPLSSLADDAPIFVARFLNDTGRYVLANNNKVRIYEIGQKTYQDSFDLGPYRSDSAPDSPQPYFEDFVSRNGRTVLLFTDETKSRGGVLILSPNAWIDRLCQLIAGREFTADERTSTPARIPDGPMCPK